MKSVSKVLLASALLASSAFAQTLSIGPLKGGYFVRHVQFSTDITDTVTDARSITGVITFDGGGNYSFAGQQVIGLQPAAPYSVNGIYGTDGAGSVNLTNPQNASFTISARYGAEALIGESLTDIPGKVADLFVAIPAPASGQAFSNRTLNANFHLADFELTDADTLQVRVSAGSVQLDGGGNLGSFTAVGRAATVAGGATQQQPSYTGTYSVNNDGSGTMVFHVPSSLSPSNELIAGARRNLMVSATQNMFVAATPGAHDILLGIRNAPGDNASFSGRLWSASMTAQGIPLINTGFFSGGYGYSALASMVVDQTASTILSTDAQNFTGVGCYSAATSYAAAGGGVLGTNVLSSNLNWSPGPAVLLLGNNGLVLIVNLGEDVVTGQAVQSPLYMIGLAESMPTVSGTGAFVNPQGVVNAATNAPMGCPIAPGELISIYGSGLATAAASANSPPYPSSLGGVSVAINGKNAPLYFVSPGQINCIVPYEVTGQTAAIVVTNNKTVSNTVTVFTAPVSPGVFSVNGSGFGDGAITHADGSLVTVANPAHPDETVQMYVSGLGALTTPVADGFGATGIDNALGSFFVGVGGAIVPVSYEGATVDAGLYQVNFRVPNALGEQPVALLGTGVSTQQVTMDIQ